MTHVPWLLWLLAALLGGGLALGLAAALWLVVRSLGGHPGGWSGLARRFPAHACPAGARTSGQTVQVGRVVYKNCVGVVLAAEGLYLDAGPLLRKFGRQPMLIPWSQFCGERPATLHWQAAVTLQIGEPEAGPLTVKQPLYQQIAPRLPASRIGAQTGRA
jgi:hypothetical protein